MFLGLRVYSPLNPKPQKNPKPSDHAPNPKALNPTVPQPKGPAGLRASCLACFSELNETTGGEFRIYRASIRYIDLLNPELKGTTGGEFRVYRASIGLL